MRGSEGDPKSEESDDGEVHADHAGHRRVHREDAGDSVRADARGDGPLHRRADPGRRAGRRRGPGGRDPGCGGGLQRRDAGGHRRPLRRDEGAVRRLLHHRRGLEGGSGRVGQADARLPRHEVRGPRDSEHRQVPSGQRVDHQGAGVARADRPALTLQATGGPPSAESARRAVEAVWRIESARIVSALARYTGQFELAEDVAQEALAEALVTWSREGTPANPVGWLLATARRRAIDAYRRGSALRERYAMLGGGLAEGEAVTGATPARERPDDPPWDPDRIDDDVLALMF